MMLSFQSQQVIVGMNFLCDNYLNLDLTPDHAHLIHTPTQQYQVLVVQSTEPCPSPQRWRTENKIRGGDSEQAPLQGAPPKLNQMDMIRAGPDNVPVLMLKSAQHDIIPGRTARPVSVTCESGPLFTCVSAE